MKKILLFCGASLLLYAQNGIEINGVNFSSFGMVQGSGIMSKKTFNLKAFKKIKVNVSCELIIQKADSYGYTIQADDNLIDLVEIRQQGDGLTIGSKQNYQTNNRLKLIIRTKRLASLMVEGASDVQLKNLNEHQLFIDIAGAVDLTSLSGTVHSLTLKANGAYDMDLSRLKVENAKVDMRGSGDLDIYVTRRLDAKVSDNASLDYSGGAIVVKKIVDNGEINKK